MFYFNNKTQNTLNVFHTYFKLILRINSYSYCTQNNEFKNFPQTFSKSEFYYDKYQ